MRRLFFVLILLLIGMGMVLMYLDSQLLKVTNVFFFVSDIKKETVTPPQTTVGGGVYAYHIIPLAGRHVDLISNLDDHLSSQELIKKYRCKQAASGGFYDKNHTAIGLLIIDGEVRSHAIPHDLFIGYVSSPDGKTLDISRAPPTDYAIWALQSGPIVWDGGVTTIQLVTDEQARRVVIATDTSGNGYLITVHSTDSTYSGPLLTRLPELIGEIASKEHVSWDKALNLDGGVHSFFKNHETDLPAFAIPGSMLCVR